MALIQEDRILETSTSVGTGDMSLISAPVGYRRFNSVCVINDTFYGAVVAVDHNGAPTGQWETGYYAYSNTNTVRRDLVLASSNGGVERVNFAAGTKHIFIDLLAHQIKNAGVPNYVMRNIEWYGDARVRGLDGAFSDGRYVANPTPAVFANNLPSQPPYTVYNRGVNSNTTRKQLDGTNGSHPAWTTQMSTSTAKIILLQYGASDISGAMSVADYKANLNQLAAVARNAGKYVILVTPPPTGDNDLTTFAQGVRDQAAVLSAPVIDFFKYTNDYMAANSLSLPNLLPDNLHPSQATYELLGKYAASIFVTLPTPAPSLA